MLQFDAPLRIWWIVLELTSKTIDSTPNPDLKDAPAPEPEQTIWQEVKNNPRVIAYAVLANAGSMAFGYDILLTGAVNALPAFQRVSRCRLSVDWN